MAKLIECVPNFSEGRDRTIVDRIARAISGVSGVTLLDVDPGAATNRTVYTFVGPPGAVVDAAREAAHAAAELIDMRRHRGAHPRIGALDVCPFVPVSEVTMAECVELAHSFGGRLADELQIPVYFYEHAAGRDQRRHLADIRAGEYEGLPGKLSDPAWAPDCGPSTFNPKLGATIVGAREFLIAYNVNLNTRDKRLAQQIALSIRETGRIKRDAAGVVVADPSGTPERVPGRLKAVRAIGWYIEEYRQAQVSINLLSYRTTPVHVAFETVKEEAERLGVRVTGSELVGMTPLEPVLAAGRFYLIKQGKSPGEPEPELVEIAVRSLGLDQLAPFEPKKKIIENAVRSPAPLASLTIGQFVDEVSSSSPAPGGGSVAALAGSLAAALAAMVANLTVGRPEYSEALTEMSQLAERAQQTKQSLVEAVDDDTRAFTRMMEAMRMPRKSTEEQQARDRAIVEATRHAIEVPLNTARRSLEALELAGETAAGGYREAVSDAGVAALLAAAAVESAVLNVAINLRSLQEDAFTRECRNEAEALRTRARSRCDEIVARIRSQLA